MNWRYIIALFAAAIAAAQTPTQKTRDALYTEANTLLPDNVTEEITPQDLRTILVNIIASVQNILSDGTTGAGAYVRAENPTLTAQIYSENALGGGTAIDVTRMRNTRAITGTTTLTFSATPAAGQWFAIELTADNADRVVTIPQSYSIGRQAPITEILLKANTRTRLTWIRTASDYLLYGDPVPLADDTPFGVGWDNLLQAPTMNTVYDQFVVQQAAIEGKEPTQTAVSQAEAEAGSSTSTRSWTPERVKQAIAALVPSASTTTAGKVELATNGENGSGLAVQASDGRLSDARTPTSHTHPQSEVTNLVTDLAGKEPTQTAVSQAEAEAGSSTSTRSWTPQRVAQAIAALAPAGGGGDTVISPSQYTGENNDINPTGLSTATVIRVDADTSLPWISSITAQSGRRLRLENVGSNTLILKDQAGGFGTAANRLANGGHDIPLWPNTAVDYRYDSTSSRWRLAGGFEKAIPPRRSGYHAVRHAFPVVAAVDDPLQIISNNSGTGATVTVSSAESGNPTQYAIMDAGTTSSGRAAMVTGSTNVNVFLLGNDWLWRMDTSVRIPTLSDGTDSFTVRAGFVDSAIGDGADGVFFRYIHSANSGNWVGVVRANSNETIENLSAGPSANTWHKLSVVVTPTRAEWYQDGVLIGSTTTMTNLPSGAGRQTHPGFSIIKSAGTTSRTYHLSYLEIFGYKATP